MPLSKRLNRFTAFMMVLSLILGFSVLLYSIFASFSFIDGARSWIAIIQALCLSMFSAAILFAPAFSFFFLGRSVRMGGPTSGKAYLGLILGTGILGVIIYGLIWFNIILISPLLFSALMMITAYYLMTVIWSLSILKLSKTRQTE